MLTGTQDVRFWGKTGCERRTVKTALLTLNRHSVIVRKDTIAASRCGAFECHLLGRFANRTAREFRFGTRADAPIYDHCPVATMPR
jgi:hypothetical protein